jgi:hypothetical protein
VDKYDAIKHGHTANPGAQEQKAEQGKRKKKSNVSVEYM